MIDLEAFRDKEIVQGLAARIREATAGRPGTITLMEVCGTHTMSIYQYGLRSLLPPQVRLISGPGCPVCVTPVEYVDRAVAYARLPDTVIATFGDMVRVPGSSTSLVHERARGADVRVVYSPLDAVKLAAGHPEKRVIFLGVGFETTAPAVAGSVLAAAEQGLDNYHVLTAHKTIPTTMEILAGDPEIGVDGYLCPAHVSAIIGGNAFLPLAEHHGIPCVVAGFEPADVMHGVEMLVRQIVQGRSAVEIQYCRFVSWEGNLKAQAVLRDVFRAVDAVWRGLGVIPGSGLEIAAEYRRFDAARALPVEAEEPREAEGCRCGDILKGKMAPADCPLFGEACTPETPVGACMVSSEGSCAAAFKYPPVSVPSAGGSPSGTADSPEARVEMG